MERGLVLEVLIMTPVELQARLKEQQVYTRYDKLKYRGVEYTKTK